MNSPATNPHSPPAEAPLRHVLVADDDPASRRFLADGLRSMGVQVAACRDGLEALVQARATPFDLLMLDCRMPGAGALQILRQLRNDPLAASVDSIAIATTAELLAADRQPLFAAGFIEILCKPCTVADLQRLLGLLPQGWPDASVLDDDAALRSTGNATTMRALRLLLREELALLLQELDPLSRDPVGLGDRMHRLRSSCGFCGAASLASEAVSVQGQLATGSIIAPESLAHLRQVLLTTMRALDS